MTEVEDILRKIEGELFIRDFLHKSIVNTLVKKFSNLYEIYHLSEEEFLQLRGAGQTKIQYLKEFKNWIDNNHKVVEDYYEYVVKFKIIPTKPEHDKSILENLYQALKELRGIIEVKLNLPYTGDSAQLKIQRNQPLDKNGWVKRTEINQNLIDLIDWYYGLIGNRIFTKNEIGLKKDFDSYNVNHIIIKPLKNLFLRGEVKYGVQLNKDLRRATIEELENSYYKNYRSSGLIENDIPDFNLLSNILELFDADLVKNSSESYSEEFVIVPSGQGSEYITHYEYLNALFLFGNSYTYNEILDIDAKQGKTKLINKSSVKAIKKKNGPDTFIIQAILNSSNKIEKIKNDSDEWQYQYKWEFLHGDNNRIDRVLLEEGGVKSEEEIIELFNERAVNYQNIDEKKVGNVKLSTSKNILPIGRTKNWIHKIHANETLEKSLSVSLQSHIDELLSNKFKGKASFEDIKQQLSEEIINAYPEKSIKIYLQNIAFQTRDDNDVFVHKDFVSKFSNLKFKKKQNKFFGNELFQFTVNILRKRPNQSIDTRKYLDLVQDEFPENSKTNFYTYLNKFIEKNLIITEKEQKKNQIKLDLDEIENYDLDKLFKAEEPAYRVKIRSKLIEALKNKANQKIQLASLAKDYLGLLPEGYTRTNFYKILDDSSLFRKVEDSQGTVWIELVKEYLPAAKSSHEEVVDEPAKKDEDLNLVLRKEVDLTLLRTTCFDEILDQERRYGLDQELLENSFKKFLFALRKNDGTQFKRYGDRLLQSVFQFLIGKTDIYDREICFSLLTSSYQTYLSNLLDDDNHYPGQTALFLSNDKMKKLWKYKFEGNASNIKWMTFSKILHSLKYFSDKDRHQKDHEDLSMGALKLTKNIIDFIALYLFTAYIVIDRERDLVQ